MEKILVIEDDETIRSALKILLESQEYIVDEVANGVEGIAKFDDSYSLVVLDVLMPQLSGIDTCKAIREKSYVPVLFLTARSSEIDKMEGLSAGGDDYLVKPFSSVELIARVKALIRRYSVYNNDNNCEDTDAQPMCIERAGIKVYTRQNRVEVEGEEIRLTEKEYQILKLLISHPDKIFSLENIYNSVWEEEYIQIASNTVMVHVKNIRRKISNACGNMRIISNVWGKGYKFEG